MSNQPSTAREALLAELLGDMQTVLARFEQADQSARATADAITRANDLYREQIDDLVGKLRAETASIVLKTTEHAAQTLLSHQQAALQKAAANAMAHALTEPVVRRLRRDWLQATAVGAICGGLIASCLIAVYALYLAG